MPRISLVVPAYNEEKYIPVLMDSVDRAKEAYTGGAEQIEVIVANNASTDKTRPVAEARGCRVVDVEKRAIAASRNGGAAAATGDIICFTDADTEIHEDTFNVIDQLMASGKYIGGGTWVRAERKSLGVTCTFAVAFLATRLNGVSAGVVFCDAAAFREIGGYNEDRFFAEDIEFFKEMRRLGKKRGLKTVLKTNTPSIISTRKFDTHGDWHMFRMVSWIPLRYGSLKNLVQAYWYDDKERF